MQIKINNSNKDCSVQNLDRKTIETLELADAKEYEAWGEALEDDYDRAISSLRDNRDVVLQNLGLLREHIAELIWGE